MSSTCIDIAVKRIGGILSFEPERLGKDLSFLVERKNAPMAANVKRICEAIALGVGRQGEPLSFRCGIVCSVKSDFYLRVDPDVIWLLPDSADVAVYSNVTWTIE